MRTTVSRRRPSRVPWLIAFALAVLTSTGYRFWLDATTDSLCRPAAHAPTAVGTAALPVLAALLAGLAGWALGQRGRVIAAQAGTAFVLTGALMVLVAFVLVGAHHCFD